jgi:phosphoribosylaminoimidazolecarboxamide formyltransferase/IMP cyclohydrolase
MKVERAVLSCYDKTGIVELAQLLVELGIEVISTSGTLEVLRREGIEALSIAEFTGVPEMLNGRVKTLDSKIHAGLLGIREDKVHCEQMQAQGLEWVDMFIGNPRPIEDLVNRPGVNVDEVMEQADIGGIAMIRSAAKNFRYVTCAVNPARYATVMHELRAHEGQVSFTTRYKLAQEALVAVAQYDLALADFLRTHEPAES